MEKLNPENTREDKRKSEIELNKNKEKLTRKLKYKNNQMRTNPLPRLEEGIYTPLRTEHVGFVGVQHSLGPFLGPISILQALALFYETTNTLRISYNLPQRELENIRTYQSSESLDFEVLIVGYEHVVMNYGSAGISNMDHACVIARSIVVTNFPDSTSSKDLWKLCQSYGTVVDVYILNHRSKAGKRFAFVWFIKVDNVDRLVGNLLPRPSQPVRKAIHTGNTFASVVKGNLVSPMCSSPALVLDDTCLEDKDYENCVMGEIL
nr:RNA-directed DNA polymerase, eukaryota, nucleotide-binding alpha-beta plait domain protein [Tanacetum cinerariifolium]